MKINGDKDKEREGVPICFFEVVSQAICWNGETG